MSPPTTTLTTLTTKTTTMHATCLRIIFLNFQRLLATFLPATQTLIHIHTHTHTHFIHSLPISYHTQHIGTAKVAPTVIR